MITPYCTLLHITFKSHPSYKYTPKVKIYCTLSYLKDNDRSIVHLAIQLKDQYLYCTHHPCYDQIKWPRDLVHLGNCYALSLQRRG